MPKIRCRFCTSEQNGKCLKKKTSVSVNKKRVCDLYYPDEDKLVEWIYKKETNSRPEAVFRPDWYWDKAARKEARKKAEEEYMKQFQTTIEDDDIKIVQPPIRDAKHPMTGDLSRFIGSTVKED